MDGRDPVPGSEAWPLAEREAPAGAPVDLARVVLRSLVAGVAMEAALAVAVQPFLGGPDLRWRVVHAVGFGAGVGLAFAVADGLARTVGGALGLAAGLIAGAALAPLALLGAFFAAALLITHRSDEATTTALDWARTIPRESALALVSAGVCALGPLVLLRARGPLAQALAVSLGAVAWAGAAMAIGDGEGGGGIGDLAASSAGGYLLLVLARGPLFVLGLSLADLAYGRLRRRDLGPSRPRSRDLALLVAGLAGLVAVARALPIEAARTTFARAGAALGRPASQVALADRLAPPRPTYFGTIRAWFGPPDVALRAAVALKRPARLPEIAEETGADARALELYRSAAARGSGVAMRQLALGREAGWPVEDESIVLLRRAGEAGDIEAMRLLLERLGLRADPYGLVQRKPPSPADRAEGLRWLRRGVELGDRPMVLDLASRLDDGVAATDELLPLLRPMVARDDDLAVAAAHFLARALLLHPERAAPGDRALVVLRGPEVPLGGLAALRPWLDEALQPWLEPTRGSAASRAAATALARGRLDEAHLLAAAAIDDPAESSAGREAAKNVLGLVVLRRAHERGCASRLELTVARDALCDHQWFYDPRAGWKQRDPDDPGQVVAILLSTHADVSYGRRPFELGDLVRALKKTRSTWLQGLRGRLCDDINAARAATRRTEDDW